MVLKAQDVLIQLFLGHCTHEKSMNERLKAEPPN